MSVHFSSKTDMWATPQHLFDKLNAIHNFTTDVCATPDNAKCAKFFTPEQNGLDQDWTGSCWMNPPYGRKIREWVEKAWAMGAMHNDGTKVVCLLPARTDTSWWHDFVIPYGKVEFLRGRLKFGDSKNSAPFPSAIVVFENKQSTGGK